MIKVSDYIMKRLADFGVRHIFMITGGGAMHLNDSAGKYLQYFCNHHEQASAIAAEGFARVSGMPAVVLVTTGPGGLNTLTGLLGQWTDSVPVLYISGQVKYETSIRSCRHLNLRQLGDQEVDIVEVVKPLTKFAACVTDPLEVRAIVERAWHIASTGRPGPVWLDIPINVQGAMVDEAVLTGFDGQEGPAFDTAAAAAVVPSIVRMIQEAERPVLVAGHGIRLAGARELFLQVAARLSAPVLTTFNGFDLVPSCHPLYIGRIGTIGDRAGNFALQNADLILALGTRNNIRQISYNWSCYGRAAKKIVVDIDAAELAKPTLSPDVPVHSDVKFFLEQLLQNLDGLPLPSWDHWLEWCVERRGKYPVVLPEYEVGRDLVNPYHFIKVLTEKLPEDSVVVTGNGTASVVYFQGGTVKKGQRVIWNSGCASMGYDLPAAIGASIAKGRGKVVCLAGDGSIQMNIQELQTVIHHNLPIKIFVLNNNGYHSIRQTQENFFSGHLVGCDPGSGVSFPDMERLANAYGISFKRCASHGELDGAIEETIVDDIPYICEIMITPEQPFAPKLSSFRTPDGRIVSRPLEDMAPFLSREEFLGNMIIDPLPE